MSPDLVPAVDPAGLPGPPGLFQALLVFTFFLHMVFMNLTLGGTLLAWVAHVRSGGEAGSAQGVLAARLTAINAYGISCTITTGVAPLLFIQLLYQPFFYSGTILLGWSWFGLLVALLSGYYAAYLYKFRGLPARRPGGGVWIAISAASFLLIAMLHVAVHLVHVQPARWLSFAERPWSVLAAPSYWPRLLHFTFAGVAFSALLVAWWAARRAALGEQVAVNGAIARSGWRWALWATAAQVVDGVVLLAVLPRDVLLGLTRGGAAMLLPLGVSVLLAVALLMILARGIDPVETRPLVSAALGAMALVVAAMSLTRHQVRVVYLDSFTAGEEWLVAPQWGNFLLFVVLLVVALATVGYMVRLVIREKATGEQAA